MKSFLRNLPLRSSNQILNKHISSKEIMPACMSLRNGKSCGSDSILDEMFYIYMPVSVKTGLNEIEMKIQKTALRESIVFSECFLNN